jgi:mono/diheme cytochrome c family protein
MPDVLVTLPVEQRPQVADELVAYLQTRGGQLQTEEQFGDEVGSNEGEKLFNSLGCVACHGTGGKKASAADETFVPLGGIERKTTASQLARFLLNPVEVRPGTRMPNFRLGKWQANALATYLLRAQLPRDEAAAHKLRLPGVGYEYFEGFVREGPPDWEKMKLVRRGVTPSFVLPDDIRTTKLALRYSALIDIKVQGSYTFFAESNDGSELFIDKQLLVKNHGFHGKVEVAGKVDLKPGLHVIGVSFWQDEGSKALNIAWQGPGFGKQRIAASLLFGTSSLPMKPLGFVALEANAEKAAKGAVHFQKLGCASCHDKPTQNAKPLASADLGKGCLSASPSGKAMDFHLSQAQREAIVVALKSKGSSRDTKLQALVGLATSNCLACHERDGIGGPWPSVSAAFTQTIDVDLGEEGRLPPTLSSAGEKLRPEAILGIVGHAEFHVRPYMATRMPTFDDKIGRDLASLLAKADRRDSFEPKPAHAKAFESGRRLLGVSSNPGLSGFGCVNCHSVAGNAGQGTPGPDLALAPARLNYRWFDKWLTAPQSVRSNTRMPGFWGDEPLLPDVEGGVPARQRAAIWAYLRRGATPLPEGVLAQSAAQELKVTSEPIVYRTFMKNGGPRAIVVGNPEAVHVAFDANVVRMVNTWRGRFWDPSGTWTGRAGAFNEPLGDHVLNFPAGPAFAKLANANSPWPLATLESRELGGRFLGYRLDDRRRPVFRYLLEGVTISEVARPVVDDKGFTLVRAFSFDKPAEGLTFLAGEGHRIERVSAGRYVVDGHVNLKVPVAFAAGASLRVAPHDGGLQQLLISMPRNARAFELEIVWQ